MLARFVGGQEESRLADAVDRHGRCGPRVVALCQEPLARVQPPTQVELLEGAEPLCLQNLQVYLQLAQERGQKLLAGDGVGTLR